MRKKVIITIDVEKDISKYIKNEFIGVEEGLPKLLNILKELKISGDFFVTADVCMKYLEIVKSIQADGHGIGSHGYDHSINYLNKESFETQLSDISKATTIMKESLGIMPIMFRAPNFGINGDTLRVLEKLGYLIDSSVLPGRKIKKFRLFKIYDYTNAQRRIYNPSYEDVGQSGNSHILELPLIENPLSKGSPIGMGYLNYCGLDKTIEAINKTNTEYVTFLIHPWELIDIGRYHPKIRPWLLRACSSNHDILIKFLEYLKDNHDFSVIQEIINNHRLIVTNANNKA